MSVQSSRTVRGEFERVAYTMVYRKLSSIIAQLEHLYNVVCTQRGVIHYVTFDATRAH